MEGRSGYVSATSIECVPLKTCVFGSNNRHGSSCRLVGDYAPLVPVRFRDARLLADGVRVEREVLVIASREVGHEAVWGEWRLRPARSDDSHDHVAAVAGLDAGNFRRISLNVGVVEVGLPRVHHAGQAFDLGRQLAAQEQAGLPAVHAHQVVRGVLGLASDACGNAGPRGLRELHVVLPRDAVATGVMRRHGHVERGQEGVGIDDLRADGVAAGEGGEDVAGNKRDHNAPPCGVCPSGDLAFGTLGSVCAGYSKTH